MLVSVQLMMAVEVNAEPELIVSNSSREGALPSYSNYKTAR